MSNDIVLGKAIRSEDQAGYGEAAKMDLEGEDAVLQQAMAILDSRMRKNPLVCTAPKAPMDYAKLVIGQEESEHFLVLYLDNRHRLIESIVEFRGTFDSATIHSREIARSALRLNAAAVILAHNHPSGVVEPSDADIVITRKIKETLDIISVRVLDHIIVGGNKGMAFSERSGLL